MKLAFFVFLYPLLSNNGSSFWWIQLFFEEGKYDLYYKHPRQVWNECLIQFHKENSRRHGSPQAWIFKRNQCQFLGLREAISVYEIEICPRYQILVWRSVYAGVKPFMKWTPVCNPFDSLHLWELSYHPKTASLNIGSTTEYNQTPTQKHLHDGSDQTYANTS